MAKREYQIEDIVKVMGCGDRLFEVVGYEITHKQSHGIVNDTILYHIKPEKGYETFKEKAYNLIYFGKKASEKKDINRLLDEYNNMLFERDCYEYLFYLYGESDYDLTSKEYTYRAESILNELKLTNNGG